MQREFEKWLFTLLSQPTAPFKEQRVIACLRTKFVQHKVPHYVDVAGNIIVGADSGEHLVSKLDRSSLKEPLRVFVAHTDHPGFHGVAWKRPGALEVKWYGGTPTRFLNGAKLWISGGGSELWTGSLSKAKLTKSKLALEKSWVVNLPMELSLKYPNPTNLFGAFSFKAPVWKQKDKIFTKAADDLVGAATIAQLATELWAEKSPLADSFLGVLTRAEEVGWVGAIAHFSQPVWTPDRKKKVLGVSLETSRALPGAEIGKGPVVRLGDKATVFDSGALHIFSKLAEEVLPKSHQRRVMDGGSCEGTVLMAYGVKTVAISVPLGNYHNQSFEGGGGSRGPLGPAPEIVNLKDVIGMGKLCRALLRPGMNWDFPWGDRIRDMEKRKASYDSLMHPIPKLEEFV